MVIFSKNIFTIDIKQKFDTINSYKNVNVTNNNNIFMKLKDFKLKCILFY